MEERARAKQLMTHYFRRIYNEVGRKWDSDNTAEIEDLVDCLVNAAIFEIKNGEDPEDGSSYSEYKNRYPRA